MILRLLVSGAIALALLFFVIWFGYGVIRGGIGPLYEEGDPGLPLRLEGETPLQSDAEALRAFLGTNPAARLERALAEQDVRFLGVQREGLEVPGLPPGESIAPSRVLVVPGTGTVYRSGDHANLDRRALRYASAYNALLLKRLTELRGS
ncbi:MAG: hypothetical protein AAF430_23745 [Myxococcota bacterium]